MEQPPFAEFRVIEGVFTPAECNSLVAWVKPRKLEPHPGWSWLYQHVCREPRWASQRLVELALQLNLRWQVPTLGADPRNVFLRMSADDWIPPHTDFKDDFKAQAVMTAYLVNPADYAGGELLVENGRRPRRLPQGSVVVFPNTVQHAVAPVDAGERWTLSHVFGIK